MCRCMVRSRIERRNLEKKLNLFVIRARGGREAEREERQLWETPERKRSTKPVVNGELRERI